LNEPSSTASVEVVQPRKAVLVAVAGLIVVAFAVDFAWDSWAFPGIKSWIAAAPTNTAREERFAVVIAGILGTLIVFSVLLAAWLWVMSARTFRHSSFPPAGYPVLFKTAVVRGAPAVRQARVHALLGAAVIAVCIYILFSLFRIFPLAAVLWGRGG
jgi:hypothetical protein